MLVRTAPAISGPVAEDALLRLQVAARLFFPDGSITLSSLRREASHGRLTIWRIANKDMTTLHDLRAMVEKCRVPPFQPACGFVPLVADALPRGSSSTLDVNIALAAAQQRVNRLKKSCSAT